MRLSIESIVVSALVLLVFSAFQTSAYAAVPTDGTKNILLIVADDMGVDGISKYAEHNNAPQTVHIDQLASEGVFFRNAWTHPSCAPARAALLTGRHSFRTGVTHQGSYGNLSGDEETIAEVLGASGYLTGAFGKWGVGGQAQSLPYNQGFDYFAGSVGNLDGDYYSWTKTLYDGVSVSTIEDHPVYATTDAATEAMNWIEAKENTSSAPWFAYVAFNAPHAPWHIPPASTHSYALSACNGQASKDCYRAAIQSMDYYIGEIIDKLGPGPNGLDVLKDTLVIFIADNGTPSPQIIEETDSTPFISGHGKNSVYEGGLNVPMVIYGGANLDVDAGVEVTDILYGMDIFQTLVVVGNASPASGNTLDSRSLVGYLDETPDPIERSSVYSEQYNPGQGIDQWAISNGTRKYIHFYDGSNVIERCFNLINDPGETRNRWVRQRGGVFNTCANELKVNRVCLGTPSGCPPTL
ncbi:MAG: sulfatase-like hydrolase/transferase [Pseudomonadota bacterium]